MTNDQLTAVLQQVTTQMASDHQWFATIGLGLNDHAMRLDKLGFATLANKANQEASTTENVRAFKLIEASDLTVKDAVSQATAKTGKHAYLLKKVDTALRAQVQTEVSRLDAMIAEFAMNAHASTGWPQEPRGRGTSPEQRHARAPRRPQGTGPEPEPGRR